MRASVLFQSCEDRVAESKCFAGNGAEAQECSQASEQDCADVASRNLPLRNACRVKVGTITRSAQSAIPLRLPIPFSIDFGLSDVE